MSSGWDRATAPNTKAPEGSEGERAESTEGDRLVLRKLGNKIRQLRRGRGMTQEILAQASDLSVAYVSLIERGSRNPAFTTLAVIARALGVPLSEICGE
jgi:DNA-binding XRE family transcriptional regulator